jgi:hypothetical protein
MIQTIKNQIVGATTIIGGLLLILMPTLHSQLEAQAQIRWGGEVFKPGSSASFKVIGNWDEGILMQSRTSDRLFSPGKTFIQRLDNLTVLPQFNRPIQLETSKGDKSLEYQVLEKIGSHPVLFATYFNKTRDKIELYGRPYNLEGEPEGKETKIAEFGATRKSMVEGLNFVHSADSSTMLAFFSERWDKFEREKIQFILFNEQLQSTLNRSIEFPYAGNKFSVHSAKVDASGRVYLLVRLETQEKKARNKEQASYRYSLVTFTGDSSEVEDYEIVLPEHRIVDIRFIPEENGQITFSGFYASNVARQTEGVFFMKIDRNAGGVVEKKLSIFDGSFKTSLGIGSRGRDNMELPDFKLDHFIQFGDSGYALVAEQFLIDEICYQDYRTGMMNCNYIYNFNSIAVINMSRQGQVIWSADIPKFQETANDGGRFSSYVFAQNKDQIYFVFNDNQANTAKNDARKVAVMNNVERAVPVLVTMKSNGNYTRDALSTEKRNKFPMLPRASCQISNESILLIGISANKYKTGILAIGSNGKED